MKTKDSEWLAFVGAVLLGFTLGCNVRRNSSEPSDIALEYIRQIDRGKVEAVTKMMSAHWLGESDITKAKTSFIDNVIRMKEKRGLKAIEPMEQDIVGEVAKVRLLITFVSLR